MHTVADIIPATNIISVPVRLWLSYNKNFNSPIWVQCCGLSVGVNITRPVLCRFKVGPDTQPSSKSDLPWKTKIDGLTSISISRFKNRRLTTNHRAASRTAIHCNVISQASSHCICEHLHQSVNGAVSGVWRDSKNQNHWSVTGVLVQNLKRSRAEVPSQSIP